MADSAVKLPSDSDPWYVLLPPPEKIKEKDSYFRDSETNNIFYYSEIPADTRGGFSCVVNSAPLGFCLSRRD